MAPFSAFQANILIAKMTHFVLNKKVVICWCSTHGTITSVFLWSPPCPGLLLLMGRVVGVELYKNGRRHGVGWSWEDTVGGASVVLEDGRRVLVYGGREAVWEGRGVARD